MKKLKRILLAVVLVILVLAIAAPMLFDANAYKPKITDIVYKKTGRELAINGDMSLRLLPSPRLVVKDVHLKNIPGAKSPDFISVNAIDVTVELMPLLSKEVIVKSVNLDEPKVWLEQLADGRTSWKMTPPAATTPVPTQPVTSDEAKAPLNLKLQNVDLSDAAIFYLTPKDQQPKSLENISATVKADSIEGPFVIEGTGKWMDAPVKFTVKTNAVKEGQSLTLNATADASDVIAISFDGDIDSKNSTVKGAFKLASNKIEKLSTIAPDIKLPAALKGPVDVSGKVQTTDKIILLRPIVVKAMGQTLPASVQYQMQGSPKFLVNVDDLAGGTSVEVASDLQSSETVKFAGKVGVVSKDFRTFLAQWTPAAGSMPKNALQNFKLTTDARVEGDKVKLLNLKTNFDDSIIEGGAEVSLKNPGTIINLAISQLDVDRYKKPPVETKASAAAKATGTADKTAVADTNKGLLPSYFATGKHILNATVQTLKIGGTTLKDVALESTVEDNRLSLEPLSINDVNGFNVKMSGTINNVTADPKMDLSYQLKKPTDLGVVNGSGAITGSMEAITFNSAFAAKDVSVEGKVQGKYTTVNYRPNLDLDINFDDLDLGFLKKKGAASSSAPSTAGTTTSASAATSAGKDFNLKGLQGFDGNINLNVNRLLADDFLLTNVVGKAGLQKGILDISTLTANAYDGTLSAVGKVNATESVPVLNLQSEIQNVNVEKAYTRKPIPITGIFNNKVTLQGRGMTKDQILSALSGEGNFDLREGVIKGIDIPVISEKLDNIDSGWNIVDIAATAVSKKGQTNYKNFKGNYTITQGVLTLKDTALDADKSRVDVKGTVSLREQQLNVQSLAYLTDHPKAPPLGIDMYGPLASPVIKIQDNAIKGFVGNRAADYLLKKLDKKDKKQDQTPPATPADSQGTVTTPAPTPAPATTPAPADGSAAQPQAQPAPQQEEQKKVKPKDVLKDILLNNLQ